MARATTATPTTDATAKTVIPFNVQTPATLAAVDVQALEGDELKAYAQAAKDRLEDLTGSLYVDKRSGVAYLGTNVIGNVNRPLFKAPGRNPTAMIPSILKTKDEQYDSETKEITIPTSDVRKGMEVLDFNCLAVIRFQMARIKGNGVNLINQRSKDDNGVALAMGISKSGTL